MSKKFIVKQNGIKNCAVSCLLSIIRYYNGDIAREELSYLIKTDQNGTNAYNMIEGMKKIGFDGYGIKKSSYELYENCEILPVVAHVKINNLLHYIVIYEINQKKKHFKIMDPSYGFKKMSFNDFNNIFLETILYFYPVEIIPKLINNKSLLKEIFEFILTKKNIITLVTLLSVLIIIFTIINNYYFKLIIDYFLIKYSYSILISITLIFLIIIFLKNMFDYIRNRLLIKINNSINIFLSNKAIKHIMFLPYQFFKTKPTGEVLSRINELNNFREIVSQIFLNLFIDIFLILISFIVLFTINKNLLFIVLIIVFIYFFVIFIYSNIYKKKIYLIQTQEGEFNKNLTEALEGFESIKNLNLTINIVDKLKIKFISYIQKIKSFENSIIKQTFIKNNIFEIGILLILSIGTYYVYKKIITLGDLVVYNTLLLMFLEPVKQIMDLEPNIRYLKTTYERVNDLLLITSEDANNLNKKIIDGKITIKSLNYSYNEIDYIFQNISLEINKSDKLLIYGKSGTGKSTFAKILLKYIKNYEGEIYINNYNLLDINNDIIRNSFTYVSQKETLFADTLINNIILDRKISMKEYEEIIRICKVNIIRDKKKFRNMFYIEEDGFNLSGGERQKIVLARALLKKSNYLIFDEALSEVGLEEEIEIIKGIFNRYKDKTIIYISHKKEIINLFESKYKFYQKGELC